MDKLISLTKLEKLEEAIDDLRAPSDDQEITTDEMEAMDDKLEDLHYSIEIKEDDDANLEYQEDINEEPSRVYKATSKSLVKTELTSDENDGNADPEYVMIKTESIDSKINEKIVDSKSQKIRWRKVNIENWKSNKSKKLRSECKPYVTRTGLKPAKVPKPIDCSKCRFKCNINFSQHDRILLCENYWKLNDFKRQKDFIIENVKAVVPKRPQVGAKKQRITAKQYYFKNTNNTFRVCANFFQKTLCISNGPINTALAHQLQNRTFSGFDHRGHKSPGNATSKESIEFVKEHIESFPRTSPYYIRKTREYLDSKLSIFKMYSLYLDFCKKINVSPVKINVYRKIFYTQYNLSFFLPKKDQCSTCAKYKSSKADPILKKNYEDHIARREDGNRAKTEDKRIANENAFFQTITFDLQSVLELPASDVGQFYYSRKLCVYNLTIYEGAKQNRGYCFCWNELNGKRGSNEIATVLLKYIAGIPNSITHLSMFSDTCGGKNRNQYVAAALLHCVKNHPTIEVVEHKFLESGHSYMEYDSLHSAIENAKKHRSLFLMNDWKEIFKSARSKNTTNKEPYEVIELKYNDFYNFQDLASKIMKNENKDEEGNKVEWLKIKCFRYEKNNPDVIFYKYSHSSDFKRICVNGKGRKRVEPRILKAAYSHQLPISKMKKMDLIKLCNTGLIPEEVQYWYRNLPSTSHDNKIDQAAEPAADESDFEEDF